MSEALEYLPELVGAFCPMGCGRTLVIEASHIACKAPNCPRPYAVSKILSDPESEHILELEEHDFSLQHPLRERLDGDLFICHLGQHLHHLDGPPAPIGRYRAYWSDDEDGYVYDPLPNGEWDGLL